MKRYLAIIVAAILLMTVWSSAFAVYDPETDGVSVWDGEITFSWRTTPSLRSWKSASA